MKQANTFQTVILLLDGKSRTDTDFIKGWFKKSRFLTSETTSIFQALEEISDFTVRSRPDVVLLETDSLPEDFSVIRQMIQTPSGGTEFPIFVLSDSGKNAHSEQCFTGSFTQLTTRLDKMIPKFTKARAA